MSIYKKILRWVFAPIALLILPLVFIILSPFVFAFWLTNDKTFIETFMTFLGE